MKQKHIAFFLSQPQGLEWIPNNSGIMLSAVLPFSPVMAYRAQEAHGYKMSLPHTTPPRSKECFMPLLPPEQMAAAGWQRCAG